MEEDYKTNFENYSRIYEDVCAILKSKDADGSCSIKAKELAYELDIDEVQMEKALVNMVNDGLIIFGDSKVELTDKGSEIGKRILKKHNIIENLLVSFGIKKETAHREALNLEHVLSNEIEKEIDFMSENNDLIKLTLLREGDEGEIAVIRAGRAAIQRLNEMGLVPDTRVKVLRKGALRGPVELEVRNSHLVIGEGLASKIYVKVV